MFKIFALLVQGSGIAFKKMALLQDLLFDLF